MPLDELQRADFYERARGLEGIDIDTYRRFDKNPLDPIIGLGEPNARIGFFGRDPGRDEVKHGEPFIGAGGQLVRKTIYDFLYGRAMPDFEASLALGRLFFWINTVPYKPVGNKAWSMQVKRQFQPLMHTLLIEQWHGRSLITLGREAFLWFGIGRPKAERARIEAFWKSDGRFEEALDVRLGTADGGGRCFTLYPLPHPSPLNATWYARFPDLLRQRLAQLDAAPDRLLL